MLQGVDKEPIRESCSATASKSHWPAGNPLRQIADAGAALVEIADRAEMTEHGQRTTDLLERAIELGQIMSLGRIAKEGIERLFDLRQVVLDFPADLTDQQLFLGAPCHFVEQRDAFVGGGRLAGDAGIQTGHHQVDLLGEVGAQALETLLAFSKRGCGATSSPPYRCSVRVFGSQLATAPRPGQAL